jgi:hypothetical protein
MQNLSHNGCRPAGGASGPGGRATLAGALLVPALALLCLGARPHPQDERIDRARATLDKWVETRRIISAERRDWRLGRETLEGRIEVVRGEIDGLRRKLEEAQHSISEAEEKRGDLEREKERLERASLALREAIADLEARTKALLARLPDPIRERVAPLSQRIPASAETSVGLGERFQNVVGILNEVNKFNGEITLTSEVRTLPDGSSAEVTALYLGIGQGYFVGRNGAVAGVGSASADGWTWRAASDAAPEITAALAILANERVASFVRLPLEVR